MKKFILFFVTVLAMVLFPGFDRIQEESLFYEENGEGESILFIHGSQEDYRVFMPQLELLGNDFHVVTYSRRYNYPNNEVYKKGTAFNPMTEADDLEKLRKEMGIEKFNVVGHSYGGLVALAYADKYPDRLESITVSEPPLLRIQGCDESLKATEKGLIDELRASFKKKDTTVVMKAIFEFFVGQDIQNQIPPEVLGALKANLSEMQALSNSENPFPNLNITFDFPTMIITSEKEMPVLMCTNEALINTTPNARHVKITGASHDMWMTHQEVMSGHLKEFIINN
jgi:pimeloyl-ACP methyl ester carboxylesterase